MPTHTEKKFLPHKPEQMFDLVADVGRYPEFLPWCVGARIRSRTETLLVADLIISFKGMRENFTSNVALDRDAMTIDVSYKDGPFKYLNNKWYFDQTASGQCMLDFYVDFEFKSRILEMVIEILFGEAVRRMVHAFEQRAAQLYGPAAIS